MSWKNFLRKASFRGVPFYIEGSDATAGRKVAIHEFPGKDTNYVEDLGKQTRTFSVEAFVIGDLYKFQKDRLIAACEVKGPGRLIHPYFGAMDAQVIGMISIRESSRDGGMARINIQFSQTEKPVFPQTLLDTAGNLVGTALNTFTSIENYFEDKFNLIQQPAAIVNGVIDSMNSAISTIEEGFTVAKKLAGFSSTLDRIKARITSLSLSAPLLAADFIALFSQNKTESGIKENLLLKDFNRGDGTIEENKVAFDELIQFSCVTAAAQAASEITFDNTSQVAIIRTAVLDAMDTLMETLTDDEIYERIHELRYSFLADLEARSVKTPRLITIYNQIALPSLNMAYDLYEDYERADDIEARNNAVHPGFVPAGVPLEVLSRE